MHFKVLGYFIINIDLPFKLVFEHIALGFVNVDLFEHFNYNLVIYSDLEFIRLNNLTKVITNLYLVKLEHFNYNLDINSE